MLSIKLNDKIDINTFTITLNDNINYTFIHLYILIQYIFLILKVCN